MWQTEWRFSYLYGQTEGVEYDEYKHDVLKACRVGHVPEPVLVWVLGDVTAQWTGLQSILYTLPLQRGGTRVKASLFILPH